MTSSTKPEIHNINTSQCCQRRTKPRPSTTCTKKLVKFGRVVFELCERTDKQRDEQTLYLSQYFASLPGAKHYYGGNNATIRSAGAIVKAGVRHCWRTHLEYRQVRGAAHRWVHRTVHTYKNELAPATHVGV